MLTRTHARTHTHTTKIILDVVMMHLKCLPSGTGHKVMLCFNLCVQYITIFKLVPRELLSLHLCMPVAELHSHCYAYK